MQAGRPPDAEAADLALKVGGEARELRDGRVGLGEGGRGGLGHAGDVARDVRRAVGERHSEHRRPPAEPEAGGASAFELPAVPDQQQPGGPAQGESTGE
jgi:hypothetical protein